ncbi:MAG: hypothetical protein P9X26_04090 [Candidatus Stygibacter frigidus]|nr:hypothetical protein [Candidatus Stygibacter frigidus]
MPVRGFGYFVKLFLVIVLYFKGRMEILPETFVLWVWLVYIINIYLSIYILGFLQTAKDITRIYLSRESGETNKKVQSMYSTLIPSSMLFMAVLWSAIRLIAFSFILMYQGLVLGICAEILLAILIAILPVKYKSHLRNIHDQFGKTQPRLLKSKEEAGFVSEDLKSVIEEAIDSKIDPHIWWLEIKNENFKKN